MKSNSKMVKCSRCRRKCDAKYAEGKWIVIHFVTPWLRRIKKRMYCIECQLNTGLRLEL